MKELNVTKRTMMRLIREHKDQIGVPIPQPNCKAVRFETEDGKYKVSWKSDGIYYSFFLTASLNLYAQIYSIPGMYYIHNEIPMDRDWLTGLGILTDREEGLECQE